MAYANRDFKSAKTFNYNSVYYNLRFQSNQ